MTGVQRFRVRVGEIDHQVELDRDGSVRVGATIFDVIPGPDGRVAVRERGATAHVLVSVAPGADPRAAVVDGIVREVVVMTAQQAALADLRGHGRTADAGRAITSPMPGRIVRVLVEAGQLVANDTPVMIVEAMKMENEVRTTGAAKVVRVTVAAGDTVDAGQVLVELEPHVDASAPT